VIDLAIFDKMKDDLIADITKLKTEGNRHSVLLLLTDIMKEGSELLVVSDNNNLALDAFGKATTASKVWLDGVLSRKKQVVPPLEAAFAK
jgi:manganese-dependent inorganic pyrophosphatase